MSNYKRGIFKFLKILRAILFSVLLCMFKKKKKPEKKFADQAKLDHDKGVTTQHCSSRPQARRTVLGGNTVPHSEYYLREGVKYSPYCEQNTRLFYDVLC